MAEQFRLFDPKELFAKSGKDKGQTSLALEKSRKFRQDFIDDIGFVPVSILRRNQSAQTDMDIARDEKGESMTGLYEGHNKKQKHKIWQDPKLYVPGIEKSGMRLQGRKEVLSKFPQNIGEVMIKLYCPEDGLIYDPFAGHNSRMQLSMRCGRRYIGVDICKEYMEYNRRLHEKLVNQCSLGVRDWPEVKLIEGSSAKVDLPDNYADFTITSPPYWDLEYYGPEEEQLGKNQTYQDFLKALYPHIQENFRILKAGAYCIWFINDFRKKGVFYPYHIDIYELLENAGFEGFNIYIVDLVTTVQVAFVKDIAEKKIIPKIHEYIVVFKKPEGGRTSENRKSKIVKRTRQG